MIKKNIKIPIIVIAKNMTWQGKTIFNNITKLFENNNIPYVTSENEAFILNFQKSKYTLKSLEEMLHIVNVCVVIESSYEKEIEMLVDKFLESGIDIMCFPSSVLSREGIFSNNLIRDGAICITSEHMLMEYLLS